MADPLSVAGLATGVVSLGLQVSGGITKYIDALECREQDIASVRRQNDSLEKILQVVESSLAQLHRKHQASTTPVRDCLDSCRQELKALDSLVVDLSGNGRTISSRKERIRNQGKKLLYPLNRPKLEQLETRLRNANATLQLALQALDLAVTQSGTERLARLESASYDISTGLVVMQSEVTAITAPLRDIHKSLPGVEAQLETIRVLLGQLVAGQTSDGTPQVINTPSVVAGRLAQKPGVLKDVCDATRVWTSSVSSQAISSTHHGGDEFHNAVLLFLDGGFACTCRPGRALRGRRSFVWGSLDLSFETTTQGHLPECPAAQVTGVDRNRKVGLKYTGLRQILNSAIQVSFSIKSGAGGWSISPNFTYYPTVDETTAPAFRILKSLRRAQHILLCYSNLNQEMTSPLWEGYNTLAALSLAKIIRLFRDGKASPLAVNTMNESLIHCAAELASLLSVPWCPDYDLEKISSPLLEILRCLVMYKAPATDYDLNGRTPLGSMYLSDSLPAEIWAPSKLIARVAAFEAIFQAGREVTPMCLVDAVTEQQKSIFLSGPASGVHFLRRSARIMEAYDCGPLALAILADDQDQVRYLLKHHPATLSERTALGQSPLHLAAQNPSCLRILLPAADSTLLNETDHSGLSALETALQFSSSNCRNWNGNGHRKCRRCRCAECAVLLLKADCAIPRRGDIVSSFQFLLSSVSQRCKLRLIRHIKDRRERFKHLALNNLPEIEVERLGLRGRGVLDSLAPQVVELLQQRGVQIPDALSIGTLPDGVSFTPSVYSTLEEPDDAELFFRVGFQDTNIWETWNGHQEPPSLRYAQWLAMHGVDPLFQLRPDSGRGAFTAHYTFWSIGREFYCYGTESSSLNKAWIHELNAAALPADTIRDQCRCRCSPASCTPFTSMLKGMFMSFSNFAKRSRDESWGYRSAQDALCVADTFAQYLGLFGTDLDIGHHVAALRLLTFTALGITHTCGYPGSACGSCPFGPQLSSEEMDEVENEHAYELGLLEDLVDEFEVEITAILQDPEKGLDRVVDFWRYSYVEKMREVQAQLEGGELSNGKREEAEEIGVVWEEPGTENPYDMNTWEYWMYEVEKI